MMISRNRLRRRGLPTSQLGHGSDQGVGGLQRLDPAHEQDHLGVLGHAELGSRLRLVAGMEGVQIHPRGDDDDLLGPGTVVPLQFGGLVGGIGGQRIRRGHDGCFAAFPVIRFDQVPIAPRRVLDPGHRVHGVHQGDAVAGSQLDPGHPRQPVVGVDQVVTRHRGVQLRTEGVHQSGQGLLGHGLGRTGLEVDHPDVLVQLDDVWGGGRFGPGEHVDLEPALAQPAGHLGDVHVESAGVADPGRGQRGGVHADHRHPVWIGHRTGQRRSSLMSRPAAVPPGPAPGRRSAGIVRARGR